MENITIIYSIAFLGIIIILIYLRKWFWEGYRGEHSKSNNKAIKSSQIPQIKYKLGHFIETKTTYESIGDEERIVDNSKSNGLVKRKLTIAREWRKAISIDEDVCKHYKGKIGLPFTSIEGEISKSLITRYGTSIQETNSFSEEIELEIAAYSKIILTIHWKIIWQNGEIEVFSDNHNKIRIPYKVVKGITFDQIQEKIN